MICLAAFGGWLILSGLPVDGGDGDLALIVFGVVAGFFAYRMWLPPE